jgi:sugar/nucleoside kinase (ribokinase family)
MLHFPGAEPIDYLILGHLTRDITPEGARLGGGAAYAALTAQALGLRVGIVTAWAEDVELGPMADIPIASLKSEYSTTFKNIYTPEGRIQYLQAVADPIDYYHIPESWRSAPLVHLAPMAGEISSSIVRQFRDSFLCLTPQGWLRTWDADGRVSPAEWPEAEFALSHVDAAVLSLEDVQSDRTQIERMAAVAHVLTVTAGREGATLYSRGEAYHFPAPETEEQDPTGAGDVFAAAFFTYLFRTHDPNEAARFANHVAAASVARSGLEGAPTKDEIFDFMPGVA